MQNHTKPLVIAQAVFLFGATLSYLFERNNFLSYVKVRFVHHEKSSY